jgi:hypothetical protein
MNYCKKFYRGRGFVSAQGIGACLVPTMMSRYGIMTNTLVNLRIWNKRPVRTGQLFKKNRFGHLELVWNDLVIPIGCLLSFVYLSHCPDNQFQISDLEMIWKGIFNCVP